MLAFLDDRLVRGQGARVPSRTGQTVVSREQFGDLARELHLRGDEDDEVVTDPLEIGNQVRGQHDADRVFGDDLHQALEELPPCERVQAGHGLVEEQELWPLRNGDRQR